MQSDMPAHHVLQASGNGSPFFYRFWQAQVLQPLAALHAQRHPGHSNVSV